MFAFVPAALFLTLFGVSVRADRRRFRNAVYLGLTFIFTSVGLLSQVTRLPSGVAQAVVLAVFLVPTVGTLALGVFLIGNGLTMVRKEGRRPGNLLSFAAGVAIFLLIAFVLVTADTGPPALDAVVAGVVFLVAYVSFLFLCFLAYAYLYGRIKVRGDVDYVVMLGSGLIGGDRVPPLLASRLRKGQAIHDAQIARGGRAPLLLTSGGRGTDEKVAEARAMADWLMTEGGVPREHLRLEDRSRTTEENLRFSRTVMETEIPSYRCVVVTNNFHAFRAAMMARKAGVNGQVLGSPTAKYFWPSATIREFVAVFWEHRTANLSICGVIVALTAALALSA
ncbi:YdcF family protein [Streptomyces sp. NBC_01244]|uniref:YdcF family protein n=1 Tax=Streptomyces sp. NBC_01244 TaxID=2903797 RepID=UPI002E13F146|nr:YdcF family protein [Streptomyces sp. NBC_01244]